MKAIISTPWLGATRCYLSDWITQRWVQLTGRSIDLDQIHWLEGPVGKPTGIGKDFFDELAVQMGLSVRTNIEGAGLVESFDLLAGPDFKVGDVQSEVRDFYEHTSGFDLDVWGEWSGFFRPFGTLLAFVLSRRIQQLNVPLSLLDTSRGLSSEIVQLFDPSPGLVKYTAWIRQLIGTGNVLYAGNYTLCQVPGYDGMCVKVVFPLPNGNAIVIMKPELGLDGSLTVTSSGKRFGDPGFYFVIHDSNKKVFARYVRAMRESIHVYAAENLTVRADHLLRFFGVTFLKLHYRMRKKGCQWP